MSKIVPGQDVILEVPRRFPTIVRLVLATPTFCLVKYRRRLAVVRHEWIRARKASGDGQAV